MKLGLAPVLSALSLVYLAGCAGADAPGGAEPGAATDDHLTNSEQSGLDAQVLQVWTDGRLFPHAPWPTLGPNDKDTTIDATDQAACAVTHSEGGAGRYRDETRDCGGAFSKARGDAPRMDPIEIHLGATTVGPLNYYYQWDACNAVEARVVVRDAALDADTFAGIGFGTTRGEQFTPKDQLQAVGHVTLKNGDPATVYRFIGISTCLSSDNSTSGNAFQTFGFKVYAAYDSGSDDTRYRVWEKLPSDLKLGRSAPGSNGGVNADHFDRQGDLLQQ